MRAISLHRKESREVKDRWDHSCTRLVLVDFIYHRLHYIVCEKLTLDINTATGIGYLKTRLNGEEGYAEIKDGGVMIFNQFTLIACWLVAQLYNCKLFVVCCLYSLSLFILSQYYIERYQTTYFLVFKFQSLKMLPQTCLACSCKNRICCAIISSLPQAPALIVLFANDTW